MSKSWFKSIRGSSQKDGYAWQLRAAVGYGNDDQKFVPLWQLSQTPTATAFENIQRIQRLMMIEVEFSVQTWNGTNGTVFIKKRSTRFGVLEIESKPRSWKHFWGWNWCLPCRLIHLQQSISNSMYKYQKLTAIFARAVTDAGWDKTRPTAVTPWNNSWSFRVWRSWVAM